MRLVTIIAIGDKKFGQFALNCCLSIKAHDWKQKVALITDGYAIDGIVDEVNKFFDYRTTVSYSEYPTPQEKAFYTKVNLYEIATKICGEATEFIAIDADCIMIPSHGVKEWFDEHQGLPFTCWNNDVYDFKTNTTKRKDYTFWCNPLEAKEYYGLTNPMPQLNTSFMYFSKSLSAVNLFRTAKKVWHDAHLKYTEYKGAKPDELCFNIACSINNILPHRTPYYPIFFQFAVENHRELHIQQHYKAMGFAGQLMPSNQILNQYNKYVDFYREFFDVSGFVLKNEEKVFKTKTNEDIPPLEIHPNERRTLYRQNDIDNSGAGIFNPDCVIDKNGRVLTIYRKEYDFDLYGSYKKSTAIPYLVTNDKGTETQKELALVGFESSDRVEDFRLFFCGDILFCNHSVVKNNNTPNIRIRSNLSYIASDMLINIGTPNLPIETNNTEKNWVYFSEGDTIFCVYSISPYKIFYATKQDDWKTWKPYKAKSPKINFIHKSPISNSTNPILVGEHLLMWFHTKESGVYYKGAVLIDPKTKNITHYTKNAILFKARNDGIHKGILYVSGLLYLKDKNIVRVFYGEGDAHSCYADYNATNLINLIKTSYENRQIRNSTGTTLPS